MTDVHLVEYGGRPLWVVAAIELDLWVYRPRTGRFHLNNGLWAHRWKSGPLDFTSVGAEEARRLVLDGVGAWEPDDLPTSLLDWDTETAPMTVDGVFALLLDAEAHPKDYDALRMYVLKNEDGDPHLVGAATDLDVWTYVANTGKFHRNEGAWYYVFDRNEFEYDEITIEQARQLMDAGLGLYDEVEDPDTVQRWRADTTAREPEEVFERVMKTIDSAEDLDRTRILFHVRDANAFGRYVAALIDGDFWTWDPDTGRFQLDPDLRRDHFHISKYEYVEINADEARGLLLHGLGSTGARRWAESDGLEPEAVFDLVANAPSNRVGTYLVSDGHRKVGVAVLAGDVLYTYVANTGRFHADGARRDDFYGDRLHDYERISVVRAQYLISRGIGRLDPAEQSEAIVRWAADTASLDPTEAFLLSEALGS